MLTLSLLCLGGASALALRDWRVGLYAFVTMAFAQDGMRKLTDGQPPVYILFAGVLFAAAGAGAWGAGERIALTAIPGWRRLETPVALYAGVVALQALNGLTRIGSPIPPLLALLFYAGPLAGLGIAAGVAAALGPERLARLFAFYVALATLGAATVGLQALGVSSELFGEVGPGIQIFDEAGLVAANSGLFRAAEIAGWHAATAAALGVVLITRRGFTQRRLVLALAFAAALAGLAILTGRRKAVLMIVVFGALYFGLVAIFARRARRMGMVTVSLVAAYIAASAFSASADADYRAYLDRAGTVFADVSDRFSNAAWAPLSTAYDIFGSLGGGLGLATQGAQYAGLPDDADVTSGAGEGGIGKLAIELGFPGLAAVAVLGGALARHVLAILAAIGAAQPSVVRLVCGLAAIVGANVANFAVAAQTYGDVFVVTFLALLTGAILAAPRFASSARAARELRYGPA